MVRRNKSAFASGLSTVHFQSEDILEWPNETRTLVEARLSLCVVKSVWLVEQSTGPNEAWCSAVVTDGKRVSLELADCDGGYEKSPVQVSSLSRKRCICDMIAKEQKPSAGKPS